MLSENVGVEGHLDVVCGHDLHRGSGRLMEFSFSSTILLQEVGMDLFFPGELASFLGGFVESLLEMRYRCMVEGETQLC